MPDQEEEENKEETGTPLPQPATKVTPPRGIIPATLVPLDLCAYHTLLGSTASPKEALVLLGEMGELGLSLTPHAHLTALRVCAVHGQYLGHSLGLLEKLRKQASCENEVVEGYSLALAACVRAGGIKAYEAAYGLLDRMKKEGVGVGICTYKELGRACLVVLFVCCHLVFL